jgi:hypothetical protein
MFGRRNKREPVDPADLERLRNVYASLGLGFPAEALRVFGHEDPAGQRGWCLRHLGRTVRCLTTPELSNRELFALPHRWEVIRVVARSLTGRRGRQGDRITVLGELHCRPRGTWEDVHIPFEHEWTMRAGRALLFENVIDATVLRPNEDPNVCTT